MGLAVMISGLAVFIGTHSFTTLRDARARLITRVGPGTYKLLYSALSLIGLVLISIGFARYRSGLWIEVWSPPAWTRHVGHVLVWAAFICIAATYVPGNIKRVLKHPMLVGIKLWAFAHLMANGDLGSIILFGSILAWAVYDRITLKHRSDPGAPPIPIGGRGNDAIAILIGTVAFFAVGYWFHPYVIGVPVFY